MAFSIPTGSEIITKTTETLKRFPLTMLSSLIGTLIAIYLIEVELDKIEGIYLTIAKILLCSSLAIFVFASVRLMGESLSLRWHQILTVLALIGMLGYYMILPDNSKDFGVMMIPFRHFFLILLFAVAFLWAPFIRSSLDNESYWEYSKQILFAFTMAFLFTIVMIFGVNGALFAVEKLFDLDIEGKRYFQIDIFIVGLFSVGYFLSQISSAPLASKLSLRPPKVEKFFTKWLLTPLSGLYFIILYSYTFKVLFSMDWPKGILAWLIVIFSMVAILTYLFWTHFVRESGSRWRRWIWLAVLLQTVMLFLAIAIRILEYSWTESRYMVFVLGVWLAGISIYFLLFKNAKIKWIFISLSTLIAITQFGPLNAYTVSKNAQVHRLQDMIEKLKTYDDATIAPVKLRYEISDALQYLDRRYRGDSLSGAFPQMTKEVDALKDNSRSLSEHITQKLGFEYISKREYKQIKESGQQRSMFSTKNYKYITKQDRMTDIRGYDYMIHINMGEYRYVKRDKRVVQEEPIIFDNPKLTLLYTKNHQLNIQKNDTNITIDIEEFLQNLIAKHKKGVMELDDTELIIKKENNHTKLKLELNRIGEEFFDGEKTIVINGMLFIKEL